MQLSSPFERFINRIKSIKYNRIKQQQAKQEDKKRQENQQTIDNILAKVSRSGYSSLTQEEKDILFSKSNK